jgi:transposase, IS5 family
MKSCLLQLNLGPRHAAFMGINLGHESPSDETTICKYRHLLEAQQLGGQLIARLGTYPAPQGVKVNQSTIVNAPSSVPQVQRRIAQKVRDSEMHQTRKGKPDISA